MRTFWLFSLTVITAGAVIALTPSQSSNTVLARGPVVAALTEAEQADLLFMREEEKLARDVYLAMQTKWGLPIFANIARSEQTHMDAIANLLTRYGLPDPVAGLPAGEFASARFQTLYDDLVNLGSQSLADALAVGAEIEEIDILDLWASAARTTRPDIQRVYGNLEAASENHLRAFVGQLANLGVTYRPQYLTLEQYLRIVNP